MRLRAHALKIVLALGVLCLCGVPARAQFTLVSGTVTDTANLAYACGTITAQINNTNGQTLYLNGAIYSPQPGSTKLGCPTDPTTSRTPGAFTFNLGDNTQIKCGSGGAIVPCATQTTWTFTVNSTGIAPPAGTGPQTCTLANQTISGSTQTILFSGCPILSSVGAGTSKFDTNGIYVATTCGGAANCFQVNADVQMSTNASFSNTSTSVTTVASDPAFLSTDVNKVEFGAGNCTGDVSRCTYQVPQGTIATVVSAHSINVSIAATGTSSATVNANNFFWGHDDGSQLQPAFFAMFPLSFGASALVPQPQKTMYLPCGMMFTSLPPFAGQANQDTNGGVINGCGSGSPIIPLPKMNCNTTGACLFADNINNQFTQGFNLPGWHLRDITFWGGGTDVKDAAATYSNPATGIRITPLDTLDNVWLMGWVWNQTAQSVVGIANLGGTMTNSGSIAGGVFPCTMGGPSATVAIAVGGDCGGATNTSLTILAGLTSTFGVYVNQAFLAGFGVSNAAGNWTDHGSNVTSSFSSGTGGTSYLHGTRLNNSGNSALTISGGVVHLTGVQWVAGSSPINQTGGTIYDDCGNGVLPGTTPTITNLFGACSVTGVADAIADHVLTSGWGTSAVSAVTGSVNDVKFTITTTVAGSAGPVLTDTFATPYWATPSGGCTLTQIGGTFGVITNPVPSALSRTGVTWTFSGTPSANTYIFQRHCANS